MPDEPVEAEDTLEGEAPHRPEAAGQDRQALANARREEDLQALDRRAEREAPEEDASVTRRPVATAQHPVEHAERRREQDLGEQLGVAADDAAARVGQHPRRAPRRAQFRGQLLPRDKEVVGEQAEREIGGDVEDERRASGARPAERTWPVSPRMRGPSASHSATPRTVPIVSAIRSFCDTVRGGKKSCANSTAKASATQKAIVATVPMTLSARERACAAAPVSRNASGM